MNYSVNSSAIWEGVFQNYEEVKKKGNGFSSHTWRNRIVKQLVDFRKLSSENEIVLPPRSTDLPLLQSITASKSIVDFGGSSGWNYEFLKHSSLHCKIQKYLIIEIEKIVEWMKSREFHNKPVKFATHLDKNQKFDILYSNSALQYVYNDNIFIRVIKSTSPGWILLEDFLGGDFQDFFSIQNFYDDKIPVKFRNVNSFIKKISDIGYKLHFRKKYPSVINGIQQDLPMDSLPEDYRVKNGINFLFKKND